jgi:hypothetical protein
VEPKQPANKKGTQENHSDLLGRERQCIRLRLAMS